MLQTDSHINTRHLFALKAVKDTSSISKAAKAVKLSQPAVTQAIRKFETELDITLFDRSSSGLTLTEYGRIFLHRVERAIEHLHHADAACTTGTGYKTSNNHLVSQRATTAQLESLIAVVRYGGFSAAARTLNVKQPTVHRAARTLESNLGQSLFMRAGAHIEVSELARTIARYANLAFTEVRYGIEEIAEQQGRFENSLIVGSLPLGRSYIIPTAISRLLAQYKNVQTQIANAPYENQLNALLRGDIDCIFGALRTPEPSKDIEQIPLFDDHMIVVSRSNHSLTMQANAPSPQDLLTQSWVMPPEGVPARVQFDAFFNRTCGQLPSSVITTSSFFAARSLLLESDRVTMLSPHQVIYELRSGMLATVGEPLAHTLRRIGLTVRKDWSPTMIQNIFVQHLKDVVREITE